ncbi:MAG: tetratricopeptide repeat protein [Candidatus Humimicrobiaceae bacterium]
MESIYLIYNYIGYCIAKQGKDKLSEEYFRKVINSNQNNPIYYYNLAIALIRQEEYGGRAKSLLIKALDIREDFQKVKYNLGVVYSRLGMFKQAEEIFKSLIEVFNDFILEDVDYKEERGYKALNDIVDGYYSYWVDFINEIKLTKQFAVYEKSLKKLAAESKKDIRREWVNFGIEIFHRKKYEKAEKLFSKTIEIDKKFLELVKNYVFTNFEDNNLKEAEIAFKKYSELLLDIKEAMLSNGLATAKREGYGRAANIFTEVLTIDSQEKQGWDNLGILWLKQGKIEEAKNAYEASIKIDDKARIFFINIPKFYLSKRITRKQSII